MNGEASGPYAAYPAFEAAFEAAHGAFSRKRPFAMLAVELELRKEMAAIAGFGAAQPRPWAERLAVDLLTTLSLHLQRPASAGSRYYVKLGGMPELRADIAAFMARRGLGCLSDDRVLGFRRPRQLHALATRGRAFAAFLDGVARQGAARTVGDAALMLRLDADIRRNRDEMARLMRDLGLRMMISDGDAMPWQRVMISAAREVGIPFVTIAHGYIQNPNLVSIAPIHGDALATWTATEAGHLRAVLPPAQASKVTSFGFPRRAIDRRCGAARHVLVAWDPVSLKPEPDRPRQIEMLRGIAADIERAGMIPRIRLHPKDRAHAATTVAVTALGHALSDEPLEDALGTARAVVGSTSSVIFEAVASGIPGLQIAEHTRGVQIAGAQTVRSGDLAAVLGSLPEPAETVSAFDFVGFGGFLQALLDR